MTVFGFSGATLQVPKDTSTGVRGEVDSSHSRGIFLAPRGVHGDFNGAAVHQDAKVRDRVRVRDEDSDPALRASLGAGACGGTEDARARKESFPLCTGLRGPVRFLEDHHHPLSKSVENDISLGRSFGGVNTKEPPGVPRRHVWACGG